MLSIHRSGRNWRRYCWLCLAAIGVVMSSESWSSSGPIFAQEPPSTGTAVPNYAPLDRAVLEFMGRIGCQASTAAVSRQGKLLFSRGYGWSDAHKKKPTAPDSLMRIAGLTQPITAAAVKKLIRERKIAPETRAFDFLHFKPPAGSHPDPRLDRITVGLLLENKAGWDAEAAFDPFTRLREIRKSLRLARRPRQADIIRYMLSQPLQFDPGQRMAVSNFGYCVLGRMIENASARPYGSYIADDVFRPLGVADVKVEKNVPSDPREVWYSAKYASIDLMDSCAGLVMSAPALCKFLDSYWANGDPRRPGEDLQWTYLGGLPGTTAIIRQRPDGYNIAILCNGRRTRSLQTEDDRVLERFVNETMDKVAAAK